MTNADVVRAHYSASERGDLEGMLAPLAPDATWTEMAGSSYAGTYRGPDEVREHVFAQIGRDWDGFRYTLEELVDGGDVVCGIGRYSGTYRATGKEMEARVVHVWRLRDGAVTGFEQYADTRLIAEAEA